MHIQANCVVIGFEDGENTRMGTCLRSNLKRHHRNLGIDMILQCGGLAPQKFVAKAQL